MQNLGPKRLGWSGWQAKVRSTGVNEILSNNCLSSAQIDFVHSKYTRTERTLNLDEKKIVIWTVGRQSKPRTVGKASESGRKINAPRVNGDCNNEMMLSSVSRPSTDGPVKLEERQETEKENGN